MEIYIVEDDRTVINILEDIIETNGLGTVCGTSGRAAGGHGGDCAPRIRTWFWWIS